MGQAHLEENGKDFGSGTQASHEEEVGIQHGGIYGCQTLGAEWECVSRDVLGYIGDFTTQLFIINY